MFNGNENYVNTAFLNRMEKLVYEVLEKEGLLKAHWSLGTVERKISPYKVEVYENGSSEIITLPCSPDLSLQKGDKVWIVCPDGSIYNKFVLTKRGVQ